MKKSLHVEITLKDGTKVNIDYAWEGMARKTGYELGRFGSFTYGTGAFSPENTAKRILDFARSLWDGSEEKLETLANAMEKGMGQAHELFTGEEPARGVLGLRRNSPEAYRSGLAGRKGRRPV